MYSVIETEEFSDWLSKLKDMPTRIRLARRINKERLGNLSDFKPVGDGTFEIEQAKQLAKEWQ